MMTISQNWFVLIPHCEIQANVWCPHMCGDIRTKAELTMTNNACDYLIGVGIALIAQLEF